MANGQPYVDQALTTLSQAYTNNTDNFIADKLFPTLTVDKKSGLYFVYDKNNLKKPVDTTRTGRGTTPVAEYGFTTASYGPLQEHDLKGFVTRDEYQMYDNPLSPETDLVNFLNEQMLIEKEVKLAAKLSDNTVITQYAAPGAQWNASTPAGHPFTDITTGVRQMQANGLVAPNTIAMGYDVWVQLQNHPDLLDRVKYSNLGLITKEMFQNLFADQGITNVLIGKAVSDSALEGLTASNGFIWGKNLWLGYVTPTPGLRTLNGGYTLTLRNGKYVDRWDDQDEKVSWIRNNDYYEQKLVGAEAWYMIQGAVA